MSYCDMCNGEGFIITCCDDICNGIGHCIHGDGEVMCPQCLGEGDIEDDPDEYDQEDFNDPLLEDLEHETK